MRRRLGKRKLTVSTPRFVVESIISDIIGLSERSRLYTKHCVKSAQTIANDYWDISRKL